MPLLVDLLNYRIEVRADSIRVYAAAQGWAPEFQYEYTDTRWTTSPYFGFFTSTDIIENSTWRIEYMQVMPLDEENKYGTMNRQPAGSVGVLAGCFYLSGYRY